MPFESHIFIAVFFKFGSISFGGPGWKTPPPIIFHPPNQTMQNSHFPSTVFILPFFHPTKRTISETRNYSPAP